jgi:hypothetical protein
MNIPICMLNFESGRAKNRPKGPILHDNVGGKGYVIAA